MVCISTHVIKFANMKTLLLKSLDFAIMTCKSYVAVKVCMWNAVVCAAAFITAVNKFEIVGTAF